jgi:methyltransferase (TIGR00027 family)
VAKLTVSLFVCQTPVLLNASLYESLLDRAPCPPGNAGPYPGLMQEGMASATARSVAAHRLDYARIEAPFGNPAADEQLSRDVAAGMPPRQGRMHEYLRARTAFFDRAVLDALDAGITQVVIGAAGYDGRAFRYARPGVRWFEVDHPATQADKLARLDRLGIPAGHISFIPADFAVDPIAGPLGAAGLDPALVTLTLLEGVAVYLEQPVLERTLREFRAAAATGSTLAISMSVDRPDDASRARFRARVAALGEPAVLTLTADQVREMLAAAGWEKTASSDRAVGAGLILARAATAKAQPMVLHRGGYPDGS